MLIEILISIILGILVGIFTGLAPGIHINLIGTFLISISPSLLFVKSPLYLGVFIVSMAISNSFFDFIPSIFLGCPEAETALSILPGHEMLQEGRGYEAVRLASLGAILGILLLVLASVPLVLLIPKIYSLIQPVMFFILLLVSLILVLNEKKKIISLFVFLSCGILGFLVLNSGVKEPLLPLLTGLFGSSTLILSLKNKNKIPKQKIAEPKIPSLKLLIGAFISSILCGFLPGLGESQAIILANTVSKTDRQGFLFISGASNLLVMGISFISLYAIEKARTGAAVALKEILGPFPLKILFLFLIVILISGIISYLVSKKLSKIFSKNITKINYSKLTIIVLVVLALLILLISSWEGLVIFLVSTIVGIYCNSLPVKKTQMMGCILLPTILIYASMFFG